ncbi:MAG: hypothetical protein DCC75_06730 [Proteobacteria bacterium]|nr:MAG: hypothetical protein DCC75_06730 [Pseudomonadota bacterium]
MLARLISSARKFLLLVSLTPPCLWAEQPAFEWLPSTPDLELGSYTWSTGIFSESKIVAARSSLIKYRIGVIRAIEHGAKRDTAAQICKLSKAGVCINANFFDEQGETLGLVISRGILFNKLHKGGNVLTGILQATRNGVEIINRVVFKPGPILEAVQAGPRLISKGRPVGGLHPLEAKNLSGICVDQDQRIIFYAIESKWSGPSIEQLQTLLLGPGLRCREALNLDGGSSTQFAIAPQIAPDSSRIDEFAVVGKERVPVVLALIPLSGG